ncbi:2-octaprenyl-6-methoxyphenyl hydroxylase [Thalassomonas sp. M1454]|uniref:2-octaprenyl-6-methoxyphenyl hydroxylase n=1 Tax=Thalassomonas sp. M1454 TaxID=2594477 RepID=UPI00117EEA49|nr:2-octaprenyl-6-methoxyphenyl hydroxylase [Thalassomonas sp. M1454]TRX54513.1 2-octaprenyl-6-methoxyphenyl hydroxylase [Thalassomonas sp. M1454]
MSTAQQFDIIISGAALAGASMALALSKLQKPDGTLLSIAVVETFPVSDQLPKSYDARVIALSHASAAYLNELDVWQQLKPDAMAIKTIHISDCDYYGKARMYAEDYNVSALGFVSEMQAIGNAIISPLKQSANVTFFAPDSISDINWQSECVSVQLSSGQSIQAKLLLGCDGGQSMCRKQAKIDTTENDYQQVAIIANVTPEKPHNNRAFERFSEFGPIALLPMTDNRCSLVWTVKPEHVEPLLALSDDEFATTLADKFGRWLGDFSTVGKRFSFELKLIQANEQIHHRMALLGNAAHSLHPIAGQGFNLGIRDVEAMAKYIKQALTQNQDIGSYKVLSAYAQSREPDHKQVITLTDSLVHLFSNKYTPLVIGRGVGLKVLNYVSPLKSALAQKTMGH